MGIEKFFLNLKSNKNFNKNITIKLTENFDYIYIDFNSVICKTVEELEQKLNYVKYEQIYNSYNSIEEFSEEAKKIIEQYIINVTNINDNLDTIFLNTLSKNITTILNEINKDYVKSIFIAFDGIPTMAKIVEQRRRKYTKYILDEIRNRIYKKYESSIDTIRREFENNKIKIDLSCKIDEETIKKMINLNNINIIISDKTEIGEGEKKIFEHISRNYNKASYLIISPDSDVIILALLHQNLMKINLIESSFHIIKNINPVEYINIDHIHLNLSEYALNRIEKFKIEERHFIPNECNILLDIIFLIQFLGNDFIPKLNCLISRSSLTILIDIYIRHITRTKNKFKYLVFNENNIFKLNYENLNSIIFKLSENEHKLLYESYCVNNYKNFNYLLSIFDVNDESPFFYDKFTSYIYGFNKIITYIITNKNTNKTGKDIYDNVLNKYLDRDVFMKVFLLIESDCNYNIESKAANDLVNDTIEILDKIVENIKSNKFYKGKLRFVKYSSSVNDFYHLQQILNTMEHPKMIITDYDKNFYKFEKKLDEYFYILSSESDLKLGYIDINFKNNYYKLLIDNNIEENKKNFYQEKIKTLEQTKIKEICNSYLLGLFWNFDFYFNKNNHQTNTEHISIWYYEQDTVPFLKDLQLFMKELTNKTNNILHYECNKMFYQIINYTSSFYVTKDKYLTDIEQYIYITPNEKLYGKIPDKYNQLILNQNIFPNIRNIIEEIIDGNITKYIDMTNCTYINKCKILGLNIISYNELIKHFIRLR
jgi:5'-3' exonuclease